MSEDNEHNWLKFTLVAIGFVSHFSALGNYFHDFSQCQCFSIDNRTVVSETCQDYKLNPDLSDSPVLRAAPENNECSLPNLNDYIEDDLIAFAEDERRKKYEDDIENGISGKPMDLDLDVDHIINIPPDKSLIGDTEINEGTSIGNKIEASEGEGDIK